jgi:hypothetical protein
MSCLNSRLSALIIRHGDGNKSSQCFNSSARFGFQLVRGHRFSAVSEESCPDQAASPSIGPLVGVAPPEAMPTQLPLFRRDALRRGVATELLRQRRDPFDVSTKRFICWPAENLCHGVAPWHGSRGGFPACASTSAVFFQRSHRAPLWGRLARVGFSDPSPDAGQSIPRRSGWNRRAATTLSLAGAMLTS